MSQLKPDSVCAHYIVGSWLVIAPLTSTFSPQRHINSTDRALPLMQAMHLPCNIDDSTLHAPRNRKQDRGSVRCDTVTTRSPLLPLNANIARNHQGPDPLVAYSLRSTFLSQRRNVATITSSVTLFSIEFVCATGREALTACFDTPACCKSIIWHQAHCSRQKSIISRQCDSCLRVL